MISLYPTPKLQQQVVPTPLALWALERMNNGYGGPTCKVRRSADNAVLDVYNLKEIVSFCAGSNGFVHTMYDQSGNGRDIGQGSAAGSQPKVYDVSAGLNRLSGKHTVYLAFDGTDDYFERADSLGLTGSPALTSGLVCLDWTATGTRIFGMGSDLNDGTGEQWYFGLSPGPVAFVNYRVGNRVYTCADPATTPSTFVLSKAANDNATAVVGRQNEAVMTQSSAGSGTQALRAGVTRWGANVTSTVGQFAPHKGVALSHYNAQLLGQDLAAYEQYLKRMRTT